MNYPNGNKYKETKNIHYDNRGMSLEKDLNITNQYYVTNNIAFIYKKPTPIQITKVDFKNRKNVVIKEAFFKEPSTTDYNGLYKGTYIDYEAKETNSKTSFPLANIHKHQIKHLKDIYSNGGLAFLIIRFNKINKTFLIKAIDFINFIEQSKRKSIPLSFFEQTGFQIEEKYNIRLDYLKIVDKLLEVQND